MKRIKYINLFETKNEYDNSLNELPNISINYISETDKCKIILKEEEDLTPETRFVFVEGQNQVRLSSNGDVIIESVQGGEKVSETYSDLNDTVVTINADSGTEIVIYGAVTILSNFTTNSQNIIASLDLSKSYALTVLQCDGCTSLTSIDVSNSTALTELYCSNCTSLTSIDVSNSAALTSLFCFDCKSLTSLDVSKNIALTNLYCNGCTSLTSLDVSKNTALTYLYCYGCQNLLMLNIENTAMLDGTILNKPMVNLTMLRVSGTSEWAYGQVESWLINFAPVGGTIYVDDNTPQGVITEAQSKSWTVEYVN